MNTKKFANELYEELKGMTPETQAEGDEKIASILKVMTLVAALAIEKYEQEQKG